jgi:AcrR family transcriptional regulator
MPTKDVAPPGRTYSAHRERQRRRILEAVQKLFDHRGIDRVTMAEIISSTGLRASTIYQYFSNKDDIVWAILGEVMADSAARAKEATETAKTALAKITALLELMVEDLAKDKGKSAFSGAVRYDVRAGLARLSPPYAGSSHQPSRLSAFRRPDPRGFRERVAPSRSGSRTHVACRHQCGDRGAATARVAGNPIGVGVRTTDRPVVPEIIRVILLGLRKT